MIYNCIAVKLQVITLYKSNIMQKDIEPFHVASQKIFFRHAEKFYLVIFTK